MKKKHHGQEYKHEQTQPHASIPAPVPPVFPPTQQPPQALDQNTRRIRTLLRIIAGILVSMLLIMQIRSLYLTQTIQQTMERQLQEQWQQAEQNYTQTWRAAMDNEHADHRALTERLDSMQQTLQSTTQQLEKLETNVQHLQQYKETRLAIPAIAQQITLLQSARYNLEMAQLSNRWDADPQRARRWIEETRILLETLPPQEAIAALQTQLEHDSTILSKRSTLPFEKQMERIHQTEKVVDRLLTAPNTDTDTDTSELAAHNATSASCIPPTNTPSTETRWHTTQKTLSCLFHRLVIIRRPTDPNNIALSPLSIQIRAARISLLFTQLQWALLQNHPLLYQQTVTQLQNDLQPALEALRIDNPRLPPVQTVLQPLRMGTPHPLILDLSSEIQTLQHLQEQVQETLT